MVNYGKSRDRKGFTIHDLTIFQRHGERKQKVHILVVKQNPSELSSFLLSTRPITTKSYPGMELCFKSSTSNVGDKNGATRQLQRVT